MSKASCHKKIIDILKNAALRFHDDLGKNIEYYFTEEETNEEIVVHFNMIYGGFLEYLITFKKLNTVANSIPNVKGYNKLSLDENPFKKLHFSDENAIMANIYDFIQDINFDEIVCYEKFGIILLNPIDLTGIYNINIRFLNNQ